LAAAERGRAQFFFKANGEKLNRGVESNGQVGRGRQTMWPGERGKKKQAWKGVLTTRVEKKYRQVVQKVKHKSWSGKGNPLKSFEIWGAWGKRMHLT